MSEAQFIERTEARRCRNQAVAQQLAGTDQHQAVNQDGLALAGGREVAAGQGALAGIVQVVGDIGRVTRGDGDQRIERGTPGVQRVGDEFDLFKRDLRFV